MVSPWGLMLLEYARFLVLYYCSVDISRIMSEVERPRIKKMKATRACDQCRKLRTKCQMDYERTMGPSGLGYGAASASTTQGRRCVRCTRLNTDCTFILPTAETRDGKKSGAHLDIQEQSQDNAIISPTSTLDPNGAMMFRISSSGPASTNTLEPVERAKELFARFLDENLPIVNPNDISNHISVLLNLSVRRLVAAFTQPSDESLDSQLQLYIQKYFENRSSMTVPSTHNIQSLLFLSLFVEDAGAGNKLMTAIRMACSMHWNQSSDQSDSDRNQSPGPNYIWWSLVSLDIWLYLYTGVPPIIDYMGFNVPSLQKPPMFYQALIGISEVLRMLVRPESIGDYAKHKSALDALLFWEKSHREHIYAVNLPGYPGENFDPPSFLKVLHSVVISLFILQDLGFVSKYSAHYSQQATSETDQDMLTSATNSGILEILRHTVNCHRHHLALFARWGYLQRFSEIVVMAVLRLMHGSQSSEDVLEDENNIVVKWKTRCMIKEEKWLKMLALAGQNGGWEIVLDLSDEPMDEEEDMEANDL
ncbi:hypothetical protein ABW21_db0201539 [Orbilia brochopaga]|nr:hypothetical protein ABW21_db0201539 [Drechslerella brochopaga]